MHHHAHKAIKYRKKVGKGGFQSKIKNEKLLSLIEKILRLQILIRARLNSKLDRIPLLNDKVKTNCLNYKAISSDAVF